MAPVLVLISGPSGSGKSTLANRVVDRVSNNSVLLQQDSYFTTPRIPYPQIKDASYEDGSGIDWETLQKELEDDNDKKSVVVVEGHMLGAGTSVFLNAFHGQASIVIATIECGMDVCKQRRLNRRARSKEEWDDLSAYIDRFVAPSFLEFGVPALESLRKCKEEYPDRNIQLLVLQADQEDSLEPNIQKFLTAIHRISKDSSFPKTEEEETIEEWPSIGDNLQGFAQHYHLTTRLDRKEGASFQLECVSSLTPLDMVHLSLGSHDATGSSVWMGAYYLMEALAANATTTTNRDENDTNLSLRACFSSKRVLELGCGTGVGGLSLLLSPESWQARPSHVCFTDNDGPVLDLCRRNCAQNECDQCSFALLNWGDSTTTTTSQALLLFDTVLATDVLYDLACLKPLLSTSVQSLHPSGLFVLAHVPRSCLPEKADSEGDYHASLEGYIVKTAGEYGLRMLATIRPGHIQSSLGDGKVEPLNEASLTEMEEAGAAILVFQKEA